MNPKPPDSTSTTFEKRKPNRLIREKSPYLLQHAHNPVDWYPWGEEAFEQAHILKRPIFLSIGYSTCHWCHVMEQESFENPEVASFMNSHFINIKVDREERPDLDSIYIHAVQMMTGQGGWPLSVFLTPNLKPFFGGTYFPFEDRHGIPGFKAVIRTISNKWKTEFEKIATSADEILKGLNETMAFKLKEKSDLPPYESAAHQAYEELLANFDEANGGFGNTPKFPMPTYLHFLLHHYYRAKRPRALEMVETTVKKMIAGGIYDQLGGGFARYSTDAQWTVPHFEKMLYDNAQILSLCVSLYQITRSPIYEAVIRETVDYVKSNLTHPRGGFFTGEDADSDGKEGAYYLWTLGEVKNVLKGKGSDLAEIVMMRFGITPQGNFFDPQTGERGNNVLIRANSIETLAEEFEKTQDEIESVLTQVKKNLLMARKARPKPLCDDKILTGWNGLMISGLSRAAGALGDKSILAMACEAAQFIFENLYDPASKTLWRRWRDGEKKIIAHQSDFAFLSGGLIDLFEASGNVRWLEWVITLHELQNELFFDKEKGNYFMTLPHPDLICRLKEDSDGVTISGNSSAALNGLRLGRLLDRKDFLTLADRTIESFAHILTHFPASLTTLLIAYDFLLKGDTQIAIVGDREDPATGALLETVFDSFQPGRLVIQAEPGEPQKKLARILPFIENMKTLDEKATAYVCKNFTCETPVNDPVKLAEILRQPF